MFKQCWLAAATLAVTGSLAAATPTVEYHITGNSEVPGNDYANLSDDVFLVRQTSGVTAGNLGIYGDGPFDQTRQELFSDPDVTSSPILYAEVRSFGYYGVRHILDEMDNPVADEFFIAAAQGAIAGSTYNDVFGPFIDTHPLAATAGDMVMVLLNGHDDPTTGSTFDDFQNYIANDNSLFNANLLTTFQSGETFDLIAFDTGAGTGLDFGDIQVQANEVPEPMGMPLLLGTAALLSRRRR